MKRYEQLVINELIIIIIQIKNANSSHTVERYVEGIEKIVLLLLFLCRKYLSVFRPAGKYHKNISLVDL